MTHRLKHSGHDVGPVDMDILTLAVKHDLGDVVLVSFPGGNRANIFTYGNPDLHVAQQLLLTILEEQDDEDARDPH